MGSKVPEEYYVMTVELEPDMSILKSPNVDEQLRKMGITVCDCRKADQLDMMKAITSMEKQIVDVEDETKMLIKAGGK